MPVNIKNNPMPKAVTTSAPGSSTKAATSVPAASPKAPTVPAPTSGRRPEPTGPSWSQGPDAFGAPPKASAKNTQGPNLGKVEGQARPFATGPNQNSSLQPNAANQKIANAHGGTITAWVEQASNPAIQNSSEKAGVCSVMVEDWCRQGLKGPEQEKQFRDKLNSNDYASFIKDQRAGDQVQKQMIGNLDFMRAEINKNNMGVFGQYKVGDGDLSALLDSNNAHNRNTNVPGLKSSQTVPSQKLDSNQHFAGALSAHLNMNAPVNGGSAYYKLGLTNGSGGHAIGVKTENVNNTLRHSVLDPNTGEFSRIPNNNLMPFMNQYMDQNYKKDYHGGQWDLVKLQPQTP